VLLGYALASTVVYIAHSSAIVALEQARLQQQVANLAIALRGEVAINRGLIAAFLSGNALKRFLEEKDANYRASGIEVKLRESARLLLENPRTFISLAVLPGGEGLDYYYENSDDPFATATEAQLALARHAVVSSEASSWEFVDRNASRPLIVHTAVIDRVTMRAPEGAWGTAKQSELVVVQVAMRPERFLQLRQEMEAEYSGKLEFLQARPSASDEKALDVSAELGGGLFVRLRPSDDYAALLTRGTLWTLLGGAVLVSLLSVGLLMMLIRRFITQPVATFDRELTEVMMGQREALSANLGTGEVGRLSANIKQLHDSLRASIKRVRSASLTDQLTGVANRAAFTLGANETIRTAASQNGSCTVLFIDIDNFKFVNDRYGHEAGDELLRQFAGRATAMLASTAKQDGGADALFARLSGDEFAIVLSPPESRDLAKEVAEGALALFQRGFEVAGERYPVSASIGVATYPEDALDLAELLANADAAMYQAKMGGKNRVAFFSSELADSRRRDRAIQAELRRFDMGQECSLVYMPMVDAQGKVRGCEALLRWTSPVLGRINPDEFIPIAERTGQFVKIDKWVIERALADFAYLKEWFGPTVVLSINVSSAQVHTTLIAEHLEACLKARGVPAAQVEVDLTETFAEGGGETTKGGLAALRAIGVRIAIDDFGTGRTSVQQITEYAADVVKLDKALVTRLGTDQARPTLKALIALCHAQGMLVVGEGVDTHEKHGNLRAAGCDYFQGFQICRPLTLEKLATWQLQNIVAQADQRDIVQSNPSQRPVSSSQAMI
jgi:diguanylate cyclase (GGDEF)-like protein